MRWPWQRAKRNDHLVVACNNDRFAYVHGLGGRVLRAGLELRGSDTPEAFANRLRALGLPATDVTAVLPLSQYQLLQIEAPAVPGDELKAAARWHIKGMIDAHLDDLTLDVMPVGDGSQKGAGQLFVVAAQNTAVRNVSECAFAAGFELSVIDICETTQRNVQSALADSRGQPGRASAALVVHGDQCLLTIVAKGELFYSRRLDWQPDLLKMSAPERAGASNATGRDRRMSMEMNDADIVDYGAEPSSGAYDHAEAPPLVIELQRSFDVWERSQPDQQLAFLTVRAEGLAQSLALTEQLASMLSVPVEVLDADGLFPGLSDALSDAAAREAVLPLLGALLRAEKRQL